MKTFVLTLMACVLGMATVDTHASDCAPAMCSMCGGCAATCKICRAVEEKAKKSKTVFSCECEDFCIPGKSTFCGYRAECGDCGETKCVKVWKPGCAEVRTRKILKKSTEDEEVTEYKWEVVEVCAACACHGHGHRSPVPCADAQNGKDMSVAEAPVPVSTLEVADHERAEQNRPAVEAKPVSLVKRLMRSTSK